MKLEALPDAVVASIEVRNAWRKKAAEGSEGLEFLVSDLSRWQPGSALRVAFLDGAKALHTDVAEATRQITDVCDITLDFGVDPGTGEHRRWTETDTQYAAEIRVSFDLDGFFSLVGTDSNDRTVGPPTSDVGGRPNQRSLNLGGFITQRPADWEGTVRHEFLHALSFHHAHQNMRGPCEDQFRWEDDPGYEPTTDAQGVFVPDANGRAPGIYTYLAGPPNGWPRQKVDHNLRMVADDDVIPGPFDSNSIMLYAFDDFFYKSNPSPCAPTGNGIDLSDDDKRGLLLLYPEHAKEVAALKDKAQVALDTLSSEAGLEAGGAVESSYRDRAVELLQQMVS